MLVKRVGTPWKAKDQDYTIKFWVKHCRLTTQQRFFAIIKGRSKAKKVENLKAQLSREMINFFFKVLHEQKWTLIFTKAHGGRWTTWLVIFGVSAWDGVKIEFFYFFHFSQACVKSKSVVKGADQDSSANLETWKRFVRIFFMSKFCHARVPSWFH